MSGRGPVHRVENGPVSSLPLSLVCGRCGRNVAPVEWQLVGYDEEPIGMIGLAQCRSCRCTVGGMLANDPSAMHMLQEALEEALCD